MSSFIDKVEKSWEKLLSEGCRDVRELSDCLALSEEETTVLAAIQDMYPLFVNAYYLSLADARDPDDPIRRMCIPNLEELDAAGLADTSGESANTVMPGLQHKYAETALILSTEQCASYCRHCFRRRFVGLSRDETVKNIDAVAGYVGAHSEITNVLISGGDALMNSNETIRRYLRALERIDHVRTVRLGTRRPVVLPQRITDDMELVGILSEFGERKQLHVVTQFNHPSEVTPESRSAIRVLLQAGVPVRNQAVLLRGVNDSPEVIAQLMDDLVGIGVAPYYVFQCRPTVGVKSSFQVPLREACQIVEHARMQLSGLAKSFRFVMSHEAGKIEILGQLEAAGARHGRGEEPSPTLFRFHQAKDRERLGKLFSITVADDACWLENDQLRAALDV